MVIKDGSNIDFAEYPANFEVRCRISSEDISYFFLPKTNYYGKVHLNTIEYRYLSFLVTVKFV